ncbi:hypothetical protein UG55_101824 [Frankia sp. EI5c]|uniref:hypothetical protein n=1 Tax=Frankia sp. EI5c TaxID=683316 RepID=UPI0007C22414|nr:hypothetical protein [Frankia sp. EI5c]OAA26016.1 hypothetical protein UG55_101824 [Frankia sp. EI5c]
MMFQTFLLDRVGSRVRRRPFAARRRAGAAAPTAPAGTGAPAAAPAGLCAHPAEALTTRQAGGLSRSWIQSCECGKQWVINP